MLSRPDRQTSRTSFMLADIVLWLPDRELLRLSRSNVQQPMLEELKGTPARPSVRRWST